MKGHRNDCECWRCLKEHVYLSRRLRRLTIAKVFREGGYMKITQLSVQVAKLEGMKKSLSIAQIKEVLRCVNDATDGDFYKWVRKQDIRHWIA